MEHCDINDPKCKKKVQKKLNQNIDTMDTKELEKTIFDGQLDTKTRMNALSEYSKKDPNNCLEILQQILSMYMFSSSSILEHFIEYLCTSTTIINMYKKIDCFKILYSSSDNNKMLISLCTNLYNQYNYNDECFSSPCCMDLLIHLYSLYEYTNVLKKSKYNTMCDFFNNPNINIEFRYKELINFDKKTIIIPNLNIDDSMNKQYSTGYTIPDDISDENLNRTTNYSTTKKFPYVFVLFVFFSFLNCKDNDILYKILICQYLLQLYKQGDSYVSNHHSVELQKMLINTATDSNIKYNLRADASDVLLSIGNDKYQKLAMDVIISLGNDDQGNTNYKIHKTIYNNKQNVHQVNSLVLKELNKLIELYNVVSHNNAKLTFDSITKNIIEWIKTNSFKAISNKVKLSLFRIQHDNLKIIKHYTLVDIFSMVWTLIYSRPEPDELIKCLVEELQNMSDTCTSGHVSRLINTLSGFEFINPKTNMVYIFSIGISWEDQIYTYLQKQIITTIQSLENEENKENILNEMIWSVPISDKPNFYNFYIKYITKIQLNIEKEFVNGIDLTKEEYDNYMTLCIIKLTNG